MTTNTKVSSSYFQDLRAFTGDVADVKRILAGRGLPPSAIDLCLNPARSAEFQSFYRDEMFRIVTHFNETTKSNVKIPLQSAVTMPPPPPIITPARFVNLQVVSADETFHSCSSTGVREENPVFLTPPEFEGFVGVSPSNASDVSPLYACH